MSRFKKNTKSMNVAAALADCGIRFFVKGGAAVFLLQLCLLNQVNSLVYQDLPNLNVSCYPRDSCHRSHHDLPTEEGKTCECNDTCYKRGTCCIDSEYVDPRPSTRHEICSGERIIGVSPYYYFNDSRTSTFFQVTLCDPRWDGSLQVRKLCEMKEPVDGGDLMVAIPVTSTYNGVTYKNYYCAICNYDIENSLLWDVGIYEEDVLISNRFNVEASDDGSDNIDSCSDGSTATLVYNEEQASYGYWDYCSYVAPHFVLVTVTLSIPEKIQHLVMGCRSDLIWSCSPGWRDVRVRILCGSYLGIIKGPLQVDEFGMAYHRYFRNAHCAQCNNITRFEGYSCEPISVGDVISTPTYPTSATVLFEQLLSYKGCLTNSEGLGCKAVVCANPQFKMRNGNCAP